MEIANEAPIAFRSSAARPGPLSLITTAFREIASRRRLIGYMVRAEVKKKGAHTVLGNFWWVLDPLLNASIYVVVLSLIFQRGVPDFGLFLLSAVVPFKWFTATIGDTASSVRTQSALIKQIQFPKIVLPVTAAAAEVVHFLFAMGVVLAIMVIGPALGVLEWHVTPMLLWLPLIAAIQFVFMLGIALAISAITVFYRDIGVFIGHLMRILFWISPVLWAFEAVRGRGEALHEALGDTGMTLLGYNPVAILLTSYRHVIYGTLQPGPDGTTVWGPPTSPDLSLLALVLVMGIGTCVVGGLVFKRLEPAFAKVL
jgi:lipopolysaccharide transport system permease protein/teichoic acid transport system permease protein